MKRLLLLCWLLVELTLVAEPLSVAHRGGPRLGPENALATFEKALLFRVDAIELDIHQSLDGELVVLHDSNLRRTHELDRDVDQMTAQQLGEAGVPTLQQAVDVIGGRCRLFIEIKHPHGRRHQGIEERLVRLIKENGLLESAVVISFDQASVRRLHELDRRLTTGWLTGDAAKARQIPADLGATYVSPHYATVDASFVEWAHQAGYKVSVWTVDEPGVMQRMEAIGCDAITTNDPEGLRQALDL